MLWHVAPPTGLPTAKLLRPSNQLVVSVYSDSPSFESVHLLALSCSSLIRPILLLCSRPGRFVLHQVLRSRKTPHHRWSQHPERCGRELRAMNETPKWKIACQCAVSNGVPRRSFYVALAVGTILNLINQGETIFGTGSGRLAQSLSDLFVPYAVCTYGAVSAQAPRHATDRRS